MLFIVLTHINEPEIRMVCMKRKKRCQWATSATYQLICVAHYALCIFHSSLRLNRLHHASNYAIASIVGYTVVVVGLITEFSLGAVPALRDTELYNIEYI